MNHALKDPGGGAPDPAPHFKSINPEHSVLCHFPLADSVFTVAAISLLSNALFLLHKNLGTHLGPRHSWQ